MTTDALSGSSRLVSLILCLSVSACTSGTTPGNVQPRASETAISASPSPRFESVAVAAAVDGSLDGALPSGVTITALSKTFAPASIVRISEVRVAPTTLSVSDLVIPTIRIDSSQQPALPITVSFPLPTRFRTNSPELFGVLWSESGGAAEPVLVTTRDGRAVVLLPHLSQLSVFDFLGGGLVWAREWLLRNVNSWFGAAVTCPSGTSGSPLALARFDGRGVLDVEAVTTFATPTHVRLRICNQRNQTWFTYAVVPTRLVGVLPPRTTVDVDYDFGALPDGSSVRVTAAFGVEAALLTDLQLLAEMLPGLGGVQLGPSTINLLRAIGLEQCVLPAIASRDMGAMLGCILTPEKIVAVVTILVDLAVRQGLVSTAAGAVLAGLSPWIALIGAVAPTIRFAAEHALIFDGGSVTFTVRHRAPLVRIAPAPTPIPTVTPVPASAKPSVAPAPCSTGPTAPLSTMARAYVLHNVRSYGGITRWCSYPIRIWADAGFRRTDLERAIDMWTTVIGRARIQFQVVDQESMANIAFRHGPVPSSGTPEVCGREGPTVIRNHVIYAGSGTYSSEPRCTGSGNTAVTALAHGIGHILGFSDHTPDNSDVMSSPNVPLRMSAALQEAISYIYSVAPGSSVP